MVDATGAPFKGSRATSLEEDPQDAEGLLQAVYKKFKPTLPTDVAECTLRVFENQVKFKSKADLQPWDPFKTFGSSPTAPLLVRVPKRYVWYQLLDLTGAPFKGSRTTSLEEDVQNAEGILQAVYKKHNHTLLVDVDGCTLCVFESQEKFNSKHDLKLGDSIQELGLGLETPLLVLVPKRYVWHQLVIDGSPFQSERVESANEVEDFLNAVYAKNKMCFPDCAVGNLVAYENNEAFSSFPKGDPLKKGATIEALGLSEDNPIVVELQQETDEPVEEEMDVDPVYGR